MIVLLTIILKPNFLFSQANIRLAPGFGWQTLHTYVKENMNADSRFRPDNVSTTPSYSLSLQIDIKSNWMIFAGWSACRPILSYKYGYTAKNRGNFFALPSNNYPLGVQKTIGIHRWFKVNEKYNLLNLVRKTKTTTLDNRYLLLFRSRIISGISHHRVRSIQGNLSTTDQTNMAVFLGLGLQFFSSGKDRLQLNILYSQGLKEIAQVDVDYFLDGKNYSGKLGSKASFFTVQIAYPMQLFQL